MTPDQAGRIARTAEFTQTELRGDSSGHEWWHVHRVRKLALHLAERENAGTWSTKPGSPGRPIGGTIRQATGTSRLTGSA